MLVRHWMNVKDQSEMETSEILSYEVESTNSERGELEDQRDRLAKLLEIVGAIADELPADAQRRIVDKTCMLHVPM